MFKLKSISKASIPRALERAERYRLLNEPRAAESICLDVLAIDPDNHAAQRTLLLSLTDQFTTVGRAARQMEHAKQILPKLNAYEQQYYAGIITERFARYQLGLGHPGASSSAYMYLREAMQHYDDAHKVAPEGNDEAILRHNTCVRTIEWHKLEAPAEDERELPLE